MTRAVFFDVDFTLIFPGRRFQGDGYREFCAEYGIAVDADAFVAAVAASSRFLNVDDNVYDPDVFVRYTRSIIEHMGGCGNDLDTVARRIFDDGPTATISSCTTMCATCCLVCTKPG